MNVVNGLSVLDRSFVQMTLVKCLSAAFVGIQISKPFEILLNHEDTDYSKLIVAFPRLYEELVNVDPNRMSVIDENKQVLNFFSNT